MLPLVAPKDHEGPRSCGPELGNRVLNQDTTTGGLSYEPALAVSHDPPDETFQVTLGAGTVVATGIHRFWRAGEGWTMAHDLKPGNLVRTVGGLVAVNAVADDSVQPVFKLGNRSRTELLLRFPESLCSAGRGGWPAPPGPEPPQPCRNVLGGV
jgi:hypothetical protein